MLTIDCQITGGQLGRKFADDPEETYYMLEALFDEAPSGFAVDVAEYPDPRQAEWLAGHLRALADALDEAAK